VEDFRRLGIAPAEARVEVIRAAAREMGAGLREQAKHDRGAMQRWAKLAASTYRLLDPRLRVRMTERVQLCQMEPAAFRPSQVWWLRKHEAPPVNLTTSESIEALLAGAAVRRRRVRMLFGATLATGMALVYAAARLWI
jgi:hypothetical protein